MFFFLNVHLKYNENQLLYFDNTAHLVLNVSYQSKSGYFNITWY